MSAEVSQDAYVTGNRTASGAGVALADGRSHRPHSGWRPAAQLAPAAQPQPVGAVAQRRGVLASSEFRRDRSRRPSRDTGGRGELAFFSTISTFGTAVDITLSELSIEAFYPANAPTAMRMLSEIDPR